MPFWPRLHLSWMAALIGAASQPAFAQSDYEPDDVGQAIEEFVATCRPLYEELDAAVAEAGVGDASYRRIPGLPFLRGSRTLASFAPPLSDLHRAGEWLMQMRFNDAFSREIEMQSLGWPAQKVAVTMSDIRLCAVWLSALELQEPERWQQLLDDVAPRSGIADTQSVRQRLEKLRVSLTDKDARRVVMAPPSSPEAAQVLAQFEKLPRDPLGRTGMVSDAWQALAAHYAPALIRTSDEAHAPTIGTLRWEDATLVIEARTPTLYYQPAFVRVADHTLLQFNYFAWRSQDEQSLEGHAWRVTLNEAGMPLLYETIDQSGQNYQWREARRDADERPAAAFTRRDEAGLTVLPRAASTTTTVYALEPYETVLKLPTDAGGIRSAFDPQGRLRNADAGQRSFQYGHIPVAALDGLPFNDPRLTAQLIDMRDGGGTLAIRSATAATKAKKAD
ncbi:hypothetical protein KHP57_15690 [Algiphilus sp. NNCM1]|nr:hypothetical protein [Algiphilus acroporae]MCI5061892.1 hypothetical protein [Algiphilus sp.]